MFVNSNHKTTLCFFFKLQTHPHNFTGGNYEIIKHMSMC